MAIEQIKDLRYLKLFHKRYKTTKGQSEDYWRGVSKEYYNFKKRVDNSGYHWYVVTFKDGRKELAYFKVRRLVIPHGGRLCRGFLLPRLWHVRDYEHTKHIRLAF